MTSFSQSFVVILYTYSPENQLLNQVWMLLVVAFIAACIGFSLSSILLQKMQARNATSFWTEAWGYSFYQVNVLTSEGLQFLISCLSC